MGSENHHSASEADLEAVEARFAMVSARIEQPLSEEQAAQVKNRIARSIGLGVTLRAYPLTNADEPEIALVPYREANR